MVRLAPGSERQAKSRPSALPGANAVRAIHAGRGFQAAQGRTDIERDLQQARNEVERLTLERDFYSKRASALEKRTDN
jgi:hypothetical protein